MLAYAPVHGSDHVSVTRAALAPIRVLPPVTASWALSGCHIVQHMLLMRAGQGPGLTLDPIVK